MNLRPLAVVAPLALMVGLWPVAVFAGSSQPSRTTSTFSSGSGFKSSSPPRTGTSASPMAPGGKLTGQFKSATSRTSTGTNTGVRTNVSNGQTGKGGGKAAKGPGENQVGKPSGLITDSRPPSQTRSNRKP